MSIGRHTFHHIAVGFVCLLALTPAWAQARDVVPGEVLVKFRAGDRGVQQVRRALSAQGTPAGYVAELNVLRLRLRPGLSVDAAIRELSARPEVLYAEPNHRRSISAVPNDPYYTLQYGLPAIRADLAWSARAPVGSVTIAIVDTGVWYTHGDLANKMWINPGEIPANGVDDDNDGFVDNVHGANISYNNGDPMDDHYHGTHVAGIAAAQINNGTGVAGVAGWNGNAGQTDTGSAKIMAVKVLNSQGSGTDATVAAGIIFAANKGAKVINMSLGGPAYSQTLNDACQYAWNQGCIIVAAAGNSGSSGFWYPAAFPNVISVAATDASDRLTWFSNWGPWVQTAAPGLDILSTVPGNAYAFLSGTSMATPFVAGEAAFVWSCFPALTRSQIRDTILSNTDAYLPYSGRTIGTGAGRINMLKAVNAAAAMGAPLAPTSLRAYSGNALVVLTWNAVPEADTYNVKRKLQGESAFSTIATGVVFPTYRDVGLTNGVAAEYVVSAVDNGIEGDNSAPASATPTSAIRINCAGAEYLHSDGTVFLADQYYSGGIVQSVAPRAIANTSDPDLYLARRNGTTVTYNLPLTRGRYRVRLHFAEISGTGPGRRPMRVLIGGSVVAARLDVSAEVGINAALIKEYEVDVPGSSLVVKVEKLEGFNAAINGIEAVRIAPLPPDRPSGLTATPGNSRVSLTWNAAAGASSYTVKRSETPGGPYAEIARNVTSTSYTDNDLPVGVRFHYVVSAVAELESSNSEEASAVPTADPIRVNCGGAQYLHSTNVVFSGDRYFQGGYVMSAASRPIANTSDPGMYLSRRMGATVVYNVPVPRGIYNVRLHFAELTDGLRPGRRPMRVTLAGTVVESSLDVVTEVGVYAALVRTYRVEVGGSGLRIELTQIGAFNAHLAALEVLPLQP